MKLLSMTVGGFRNLARTKVELGGITAFVSPNNYGKSNLIDAVDFAGRFIAASPGARTRMMCTDSFVPLTPALQNENFYFEMVFESAEIDDQYRFARYSFEFSWVKDDGGGSRIVDERIDIGPKVDSRFLTTYLKRGEGRYKRAHSTRSFRKITLDDNQLAIDVLGAIEEIEINPVVKNIKRAAFVMLSSIDATGRFEGVPFELDVRTESGTNLGDEDLPRSLYRLKDLYPERYDDFLSAVFTLFPEFTGINVQSYEIKEEDRQLYGRVLSSADTNVPFRIKDELFRITIKSEYLNQPVPISRMSAGTQRLIWLIASTVIAGATGSNCIGIEEIETSIHPKMIKTLLEALNENIGDATVLLTSHSPYLVQYLKPEQIYIGIPNTEGIAAFKRIGKDHLPKVRDAAYERGMGFGEFLFELMSSEEEGGAVLSRWLED